MSHPAGTLHVLMGEWHPWRELRRRTHIRCRSVDLPDECGGGLYVRRGERVLILLDEDLSQVERRCILTHELIHDERGTHCHAEQPGAWDAVVAREEIRVHDESVRRLVPARELRRYCQGISDFLAVEPHEIADEFHVTLEYAERALFLLAAESTAEQNRQIA